MPHVFGHGSVFKLVSAAGVAPAITPSQAEHVAATLRAVCPDDFGKCRGLGFVETEGTIPWNCAPSKIMALSMGLAPTLYPQTTVRFSIQLRERKWLAEP
jgi:hypothetical protein